MLQLKKVSKSYTRRRQTVNAIDDLSFDINTGEFVSIIGPSGSGKSTLLMMLGGMLSPTEGQVVINDHSLYDLNADDRASFRQQHIGYVFQAFHLIPYLTAMQNVQLPLLIADVDAEEQKQRAKEMLERVGLGDRLDHRPTELSIGQQQRVALARTLANNPDIILADEPTGNLDPELSKQMMNFLSELNTEGKTVVIVTHDMSVADRTKHTIKIEQGQRV